MRMVDALTMKKTKLAVIGLGYVGLPLAMAFAKKFCVIGFDSNENKIANYQNGCDDTNEVNFDSATDISIEFTANPIIIQEASFIVIAVPTPIHGDKTPDLSALKTATRTVSNYLSEGSIVVYESTVYPGVTEEICKPILEEGSGLICGVDFKIGYSPERINPGDKIHTLRNIVKIVSAIDEESLEIITEVYSNVVDTIYRAPSIKVAEAAKLVENAQRDINIAFMNELAMAFHRMDIDTNEVIKAMDTKWNALHFRPGLVGGHCIGVDPYYFIYRANNLGYNSQIISAGRRINNGMADFLAHEIVKTLISSGKNIGKARIFLMGMTFKEDCPDIRNSLAVSVYQRLKEYKLYVKAVDPIADSDLFRKEYNISLIDVTEVEKADCLVFLVAHKMFRKYTLERLRMFFSEDTKEEPVLIDVKNIFSREQAENSGYIYWNL